MTPGRAPFGDFLLSLAERLENAAADRDEAVDCLRQVEEAFGRQLDPAREFEAYAAWRFCRALRCALEAR